MSGQSLTAIAWTIRYNRKYPSNSDVKPPWIGIRINTKLTKENIHLTWSNQNLKYPSTCYVKLRWVSLVVK